MGVEVDVVYNGNLFCEAVHGPSGKRLITEAPADNGGTGSEFSPTDLVGTALGTCVLTIMGLIARREGVSIEGTRVHVVKEMVPAPERRIRSLDVTVTYPPDCRMTPQQRASIEQAAALCPVTRSLHPDVKVNLVFRP
jgi:putative redox protein